jgi:23S rRNA (adenine2503-C2)-methyltransferase
LPNIFDLDLAELTELFAAWRQPAYRALQVWQGLYHQFWQRADQFSQLSKPFRNQLGEYFNIDDSQNTFSRLNPERTLNSSDGETIKTLFTLPDQQAIEAVLMRYSQRRTLCISTQAGCAMGCVFCATGHMGLHRQLTSGEIVEQVLYYVRFLAASGEHVTNIVVMGMGEPFHNYDASMAAIERLNHPQGYNFGARRFTISTVGLVPLIRRFTAEHRQFNLAVSLHAADDVLRSSLLPINKKYPLDELLSACLDYVHATHRRLSFEWALIQDINDTPEQAQMLAKRLQPFIHGESTFCHVNVIPLNPTHQYPGHATTRQRADIFRQELENRGVPCTIRLRRGIDIQAGCGQLASRF